MLSDSFAYALFNWANLFIAVFILFYAFLFLKKTKKHKDRRPWDFLFLASFIFLLSRLFSVLVASGVTMISQVSLGLVTSMTSFLYSGAVLLAFISQHDLILRSQLILISKRDKKQKAKVEFRLGKSPGKK